MTTETLAPPHVYEVGLRWSNDRKGVLSSRALESTIEVATPPDFPKGMPGIWSPEHLLVAAVSSCFMTTFLAIAEHSKLEFEHFGCSAVGKLDKVEGKLMVNEIILHPVVRIMNRPDKEKAERILQKVEANCLISHSLKSTIIMKPDIRFAGH